MVNTNQQSWIQDPFQQKERDINSMDPNMKSPEDQERLDWLRQEFNSKYRNLLEQNLWDSSKELIWKIAGQYEIQDWDINKAINISIESLNLEKLEKRELVDLIQSIISEDAPQKQVLEDSDRLVESNEINSKIEEHPYSPIINSFERKWLLTPEEAKLVKWVLSESENPFDTSSNIWDLLDNIEIDWEKKEKIIEAISFLEQPETRQENRKSFEQDFATELEGFKVEIDWEQNYDNITEITIESIWSSYLTQRDESNEVNPEKRVEALNLAFEVSLYKTINNKNINRNETFEKLVRTIKNSEQNFKLRLKSLIKLTWIIETEQWAKWKKKKDQNERFRQQNKKNAANLQERFNIIRGLLQKAEENGDKKLQKQSLQKAEILKQEAKDSNSEWDISQLSWWDEDILTQINLLSEKK